MSHNEDILDRELENYPDDEGVTIDHDDTIEVPASDSPFAQRNQQEKLASKLKTKLAIIGIGIVIVATLTIRLFTSDGDQQSHIIGEISNTRTIEQVAPPSSGNSFTNRHEDLDELLSSEVVSTNTSENHSDSTSSLPSETDIELRSGPPIPIEKDLPSAHAIDGAPGSDLTSSLVLEIVQAELIPISAKIEALTERVETLEKGNNAGIRKNVLNKAPEVCVRTIAIPDQSCEGCFSHAWIELHGVQKTVADGDLLLNNYTVKITKNKLELLHSSGTRHTYVESNSGPYCKSLEMANSGNR